MAILVQSNKKPSISFPSQTGSIVTFNSQYAGLPLKSCKVIIPVTQEGTGDPSPDNVRNFVGIDSLDFSATGKNLLENKGSTTTISGVTFTVNSDGSITLSGTSISNFRYTINSALNLKSAKYTLSNGNTYSNVDISLFAVTPNGNKHVDRTTGCVTFEDRINSVELWISNGINTNGFIIKPMIERGDTATTYIPFGNNKLFTFGQTIYAGWLDVLTGIFTATHVYISSYNGETINEPWTSSMDVYVEGTSPTIGAQVVYPLPTPEVINLGGMDISTLQGENNLFSSTGETTASYIKIGG